jgi:hypothetical protein
MIAPDRIELWFWELKDELTGKWRRTSWRMTEADARTRHGDDARKIRRHARDSVEAIRPV